jgi:hypothetical protein
VRRFRQLSKPAKITAIIIACVLLALPLAYFFPVIHTVRSSFHEFSDPLVSGDYARAYRMTGPDFQSAISEKDFIAQQKLLVSRYGSLKGVSVWSAEVEWNKDGESAALTAHFKYERSTEYFDVIMWPYDGKWRVWGYKQKD